MTNKLEILYPRYEAKFNTTDFSKEEAALDKEIKAFKESEAYKKYERLLKMKAILESEKDNFRCWNCGGEHQKRKLTCYNFVSYSNTMDEDRYNDYNIICPTCSKFSYIKDKNQLSGFKDHKEIYE